MQAKRSYIRPMCFAAGFALLNVTMYLAISRFWIGGSSFLPLIGQVGPERKFLFAFLVNMGVIVGACVGAASSREFRLRWPSAQVLPRVILGGLLIGMGITLAPGTCTTAFVTGMPMLSVSSFLSAAGIVIGGYIVFMLTLRRASR
jgi:hypothetical protein